MSVPSAEIPDLSREHKTCLSWHPARALLASLRAYERHCDSTNPVSWLLKKWAVLRHRFWSVITGADIPLGSKIAGGLLLPHANGIVIHPEAQIGPNCLIFQQVTIGNHAVIGANAVVLVDVPDNCMAVGIPVVVKPRQRQED